MRKRYQPCLPALASAVAAASVVLALASCASGQSSLMASAAVTAGSPVADGAANVLLTPGGVGWTATSDTIERSADGGVTWRRVLPARAACSCFGPAYFIGADHAWDLRETEQGSGFASRVLFTSDGGAKWTTGGTLPGEASVSDTGTFRQLDFADASHGWILGYGLNLQGGQKDRLAVGLWRTADGGLTWQRTGGTSLPDEGRAVAGRDAGQGCGSAGSFGLTFTTATAGWLTGDECGGARPHLWQTSDAGAHWSPVTLPAPGGGWPAKATIGVRAPVFTTTADGVLPVSTGPGALLIYQTADGGAHWLLASTVRTGAFARPAGLVVLSQRHWLLPVSDGLLATGDAGAHWRLIGSGIDLADLGPLSLLPGGAGLAAAGTPAEPATYPYVVYRTSDGGARWSPQGRLPWLFGAKRPALLRGATPTGTRTGIRYGLAGIDATSDGGRRWIVAARTVGTIGQVSYGDKSHAVAITTTSVLITADGGSRWRPGGEPAAGPLSTVAMVSGSVGFGTVCTGPDTGQSALERTGNGGLSWRPVRLPGTADPGVPVGASGVGPCGGTGPAVCFATPGTGYYLTSASGKPLGRAGSKVVLYRTVDGGRAWQAVTTQVPAGVTGISACGGGVLWADAIELASTTGGYYAVFRSANGGAAWREVLAPDLPGESRVPRAPLPSLAALDVVGPRVAWIAGTCESCGRVAVVRTADGGAAWVRPGGQGALVPGLVQVTSASFRDSQHGWLLGLTASGSQAQVLLVTGNGGLTWRRLVMRS